VATSPSHLRRVAANCHMLRWLKAVVVSDVARRTGCVRWGSARRCAVLGLAEILGAASAYVNGTLAIQGPTARLTEKVRGASIAYPKSWATLVGD
jgi:hypothetical protein